MPLSTSLVLPICYSQCLGVEAVQVSHIKIVIGISSALGRDKLDIVQVLLLDPTVASGSVPLAIGSGANESVAKGLFNNSVLFHPKSISIKR